MALEGADLETIDGAFASVPRAYTVTRPPSPSPSFRTDTYSIISWSTDAFASAYSADGDGDTTPRCMSTGRRTLSGYYPQTSGYSSIGNSPSSPTSTKASRSLNLGMGIIPRILDALREGSPGRKGKRRPISAWRDVRVAIDEDDGYREFVDYFNMPPLDGEEGELIDDEACFIDAARITGTDIVGHLPTELALHVLSFLDLSAVLASLQVSRTWNRLCRDNAVWRALFEQRRLGGWNIDLRRGMKPLDSDSPRLLSVSRTLVPAPLGVNWYETYRTRMELDRRWAPAPPAIMSMHVDEQRDHSWEPTVNRLSGHGDSVYCLEFDSKRIITGSRDRTIKVWELKTGDCLATFTGHRGSVLCLKFDKDWDRFDEEDGEDDDAASLFEDTEGRWWKRGFMVSGSSDCSVCVWSLCARVRSLEQGRTARRDKNQDEVTADIAAVLRGHSGGVLDLKIDANWIVSCSKDALIRVWDRKSLELHCTFRGHEGPVNAVGLQDSRVVSASGDGKMMLWDIVRGERLRVFEGHDRGLACIEFKDDFIVSGSNDCKIKVWSASSGACLRTLAGHDLLVRALAFDPRSGRLVSASYDKTIKVWDLHSGKMLREFRGAHVSHIFDVKFDHCRILTTSHDQKIAVLDFSKGLDVSLFV
ncbi:WD40 repeat-like protein [Laetiporus sulphureus 93-53]|uniref:WD40 repeat-like protein n=1 Tax=Laetiporus sulphureus 93-53 TaxID=1314785 RepID=A0A165DIT8_9APHY|nr:WD40 repeat-like protein [Laetiporus sulphureus 93-53]KZT04976.1 WD40 repeat-like protein [Laetiporus sulphureus 93-53]